MGQCGGTSITCLRNNDPAFGDGSAQDTLCQTALFNLYGSNVDKQYAYCDDEEGVCRRASERKDCQQHCSRTPWCHTDSAQACVGSTCGGTGCQGPTTTSTTLEPRTCDYSSPDCSFTTTVSPGLPGFDVKWKQDANGVWMPCINGRGCPTDTGTAAGRVTKDVNKPCIDDTDPVTCPYIYSGCETYDSTGGVKTQGCGKGLFCGTDNKCYQLVGEYMQCNSASGSGFSMGGRKGDAVCASFNCLGDSHLDALDYARCGAYYTKCKANADKNTPDSEVVDPELYCHCETVEKDTGKAFSIGGPDADKPQCTDISGSRTAAIAAIKNNQKWCQDGKLTGFTETDGWKLGGCYERFDLDHTCVESFQCKVGYSCVDGKCSGGDEKVPKNGICVIRNSKVDSSPSLMWNRDSNGESRTTTVWTDNCDDSSGELYCDPCDHDTGQIDSRLGGGSCSGHDITDKSKGVCRDAMTEGKWCYSNRQCDQTQKQTGSKVQQLFCIGTPYCDASNRYCQGKTSAYYNSKCAYDDASNGCYHDAIGHDDRFLQKEDDQCYMQQKNGLSSNYDLFCDDHDMCISPSGSSGSSAECTANDPGTHVLGGCNVNYCPKNVDPYLSTECWRSPGYYDPNDISKASHHHVAMPVTDKSMGLVYCDGKGGKPGNNAEGGVCRWRKEKGESCSKDVECLADYRCLNNVCGQNSCYTDDDCSDGQICDGGYCKQKSIYKFEVTAINGLSKPKSTPFDGAYDFIVSCDKKDYVYKYTAEVSLRVLYSVSGGDKKPFGGSASVIASSGTGAIPELCSFAGLSDNTKGNDGSKPYYIVNVDFIPVIQGEENKAIPKKILVLAKSLSLRDLRCDGNYYDDVLAKGLCAGFDLSGKPYDRDTYILVQNNTINVHQVGTTQKTTIRDDRYISCVGSQSVGESYNLLLLPKTSGDMFPNALYAIIENWQLSKYYKCTDMYGTVSEGTVLTNPAEWLFNYEISSRSRLLLILIVLIGIPTLVLAGSRSRRG